MLYRYRLKDGIDNKGMNSVSIERVILKRDKWHYSTTPLFQRYVGSRVEEQTATTMEDFPVLEPPRREELIRELEKHTKVQLRDVAESLSIDAEDIRGLRKDELIELIADY